MKHARDEDGGRGAGLPSRHGEKAQFPQMRRQHTRLRPWDNTGPEHSSLDREFLKISDFVHLRNNTLQSYDETLFNYYQNPATTPQGQAGLEEPLVPFRARGAKGNKDSVDGSVLPA